MVCYPNAKLLALPLALASVSCSTANDGGAALPEFVRSGIAGQALRQPAQMQNLSRVPHVIEVNLTAQVSEYEFIDGQPSEVWTYNGMLPGPQIEAQVGDELIVHFRNELPMETTVHWHGIRLPQAMDGAHTSQAPVPPGGTFEYRFSLPDAGLYWYHPHFAGDDQFSRGLYGTILVRDPQDPLAELPYRVLVLSDIELDSAGQVVPASNRQHDEIQHSLGTEGNTLLVNGQIRPSLELRRGARERWYVLNAAAGRVYKLGLPGQSFQLVGTDGGLIEAPVEMSEIVMGPGERNELLFTAAAKGGAASLDSLVYPHLFFVPDYVPHSQTSLMDLRYSAEAAVPSSAPLPGRLREIEPPGEPAAVRTFVFNSIVPSGEPADGGGHVTMAAGHGSMAAGHGSSAGGHGGGQDAARFLINGHTFPDVPTFEAALGSTEIWRVNNHTPMDHPLHIHGFRFQILSIDGVPYPYRAWKDTVNLPTTEFGDQWYELAVVYDGHPGTWPYHCHILHHQELGMMGEFTVVP